MSSTVQMGGFEISSNSESAEEMVQALTPAEPKGKEPKALVDRGKKVEKTPEEQKTSEAARELGKRGGEAAAKARQERIDEQERSAEKKMADEAGVEAKPEAKAEEKPAPETKPKGEGDPRHDPEARVKRATQEAADLRRQLDDERRARAEDRSIFLERLERVEKAVKPPEEKRPEEPGRPRLKDFLGKHEEYEEALEAWMDARDAERERQSQEREFQTEQEQRIEKHVTGFRERMQKAQAADPDLLQRIDPRLLALSTSFQAAEKGQQAGPAEMLADLYTSSEWGPEVLIHLSAHEEDVVRLLKSESPTALIREFGRLEAKVARETETPAPSAPRRTVSNAPPPLQPVSTSATETEPDLYGEISYDEFRRRAGRRR